jgi:diguanylate cyclase (GGDEF)-like protein/PAS domain S-box-containing protein
MKEIRPSGKHEESNEHCGHIGRFIDGCPALDDHRPISFAADPGVIPFSRIVESANDIIIVTTPEVSAPGPAIVYVNEAFTRLTGYSAAEAIGQTPRMLQGPGTCRSTLDAIAGSLRKGQPVHEQLLNFSKWGKPYWLDIRITPLRDAKGVITHFAAVERDVTTEKSRLDELVMLADRDALTGVANRRAFERALQSELDTIEMFRGPASEAGNLCVAFIDIDHFKRVNDELGHEIGDAVLRGMARRLADNVRRTDMLGRIGGEEFAVCLPTVTLGGAEALAERLRAAVTAKPFDTPSGPVRVTVSIGLVAFKGGDRLADLMRRADTAMYAAKRSGGDRVTTHCPEASLIKPGTSDQMCCMRRIS